MHRGLYKTHTVQDGYIRDKRTGENIGKTLELYCYTADENNIYYDEPHIDYPDNYEHVIDNKVIQVTTELKEEGFYKTPYAIISNHTRICSIEKFHIDECNNFYPVAIDSSIVDILNSFGLENIKVNKNVFNILLNKYQDAGLHEKPYFLLFFIESDNDLINYQINALRRKIIRDHIAGCHQVLIAEGVFVLINNKILKIGNTEEDRFNFMQAKSNSELPLVNSCGKFMLTNDQLSYIEDKMSEKQDRITAYAQAYWEFIEQTMTDNFKFSEYDGDNFLLFGYTNSFIVNRMEELLCNS